MNREPVATFVVVASINVVVINIEVSGVIITITNRRGRPIVTFITLIVHVGIPIITVSSERVFVASENRSKLFSNLLTGITKYS